MTDDEIEMPDGRLARLQYSITNLWDQFGNVDSIQLGIVINVGVGLLGLLLYALTDGWLAVAGIAWFVLNVFPVLRWVMQ